MPPLSGNCSREPTLRRRWDGASDRSRVLDTDAFATAAAIAVVLIETAIPTAAALI
ncbi:hypothetical protein [Cryobacterium sp. MLB-32]|uniref:hypothetical protein n=1 Tax=Cryobacterium sp. MLB-32 TaxID=1529318 RepID=UPI0018CE09A1|nr:hypothetical protein [Cryobacterium sp. MLB-32]